MSRRLERQVLIKNQNGLSPLTGRPLTGRLETHHVKELYEGGGDNLSNEVALPIWEHLAEHFFRSKDPKRSANDRLRELDTVLGRMCELTPEEKKKFDDFLRSRGHRVVLY